MWIETPDGLINLNNFDHVFLQQEDDRSQYEYVLRAEKQIGGNGEEDAAYSPKRLCFGSEAHCRDQLSFIAGALRIGKHFAVVVNGDPKPKEHSETPEFLKPLGDGDQDGFEPYPEPPF